VKVFSTACDSVSIISVVSKLRPFTFIRNIEKKKTIVVPIHKGGDRSTVKNYRPVSFTSVVCKQMEQVIAGYIRQVWEDSDWL
jgi:hypothetical protein